MKKLKILYLEDSANDAEVVGRALKNGGIDFSIKLVDSQKEYEDALGEFQPNLIMADHSLFEFNSLEALKIFKRYDLKIPFILVTGTVSEEFAVNILKEGADDYILKDNLARLPNAILSSLKKYRLEMERQEYWNNIIANETLMKEAEQVALFGSWEADVVTGVVKWSDGLFRLYGYEPGEVKPGHDTILLHFHPNDKAAYQNAMFSLLKKQDVYAAEIKVIDKNGKHKFVFLKIVVKRNTEGKLTRLLGFMQDVTKKRELEKELAEQQLRQQKLITEVTIQAQEKERNELGRELHDNINQILATVKMYLGIVKSGKNIPEDLLGKSYDFVDEAIKEIRKLSHSLVAPSLGDMGLKEALEELVEDSNLNYGVEIQISVDNKYFEKETDKNKELMLYRIVQEQLNNIFKYARATEVIVSLHTDPDNLFLSVADNGVGFNPSEKSKGIGLKNISSRVKFYSGSMKINSAPGKGCSLEISIPV